MADDIQIKSASPQGSQQGGSGISPSKGSTSKIPQDGTPVIDLRNIGQTATGNSSAQAGNAAAAPSSNAPIAAVQAKPATTDSVNPAEDNNQFTAPSGQKYTIPAWIAQKFPDLVKLIKETESMNDEEREYWFQIMPIMTEDQIKKFRDILVNEKEQLSKLDKEYEQELTKLNEKHLIEWKEFETKEKRRALTQAEQKSKAEEQASEEDLLKRLSQV